MLGLAGAGVLGAGGGRPLDLRLLGLSGEGLLPFSSLSTM